MAQASDDACGVRGGAVSANDVGSNAVQNAAGAAAHALRAQGRGGEAGNGGGAANIVGGGVDVTGAGIVEADLVAAGGRQALGAMVVAPGHGGGAGGEVQAAAGAPHIAPPGPPPNFDIDAALIGSPLRRSEVGEFFDLFE